MELTAPAVGEDSNDLVGAGVEEQDEEGVAGGRGGAEGPAGVDVDCAVAEKVANVSVAPPWLLPHACT